MRNKGHLLFGILFGVGVFIVIGIFLPTEAPVKYENHIEKYSKVNLNIRSGPGTDWEIIKTIKPNEKVIIYDTIVDGFTMVLNPDSTKYGWTAINYLQSSSLSPEQLETSEPKEKHGLSKAQRKEIWKALINAEDRAQEEADERYTTDVIDPNYAESNIEKNIDLYRELRKKYRKDLESEYDLDVGILDSITHEGIRSEWTMPER